MSVFQIDLTGFEFPRELPNRKANFRFVVDLRFTNERGQFITEHAVMPSLDTFWECDTGERDKPNYVRNEDEQDPNGPARFDMDEIDDWDKLVLLVKGQSLHSIQFKVFDVNRQDGWDKVKDFLKGVVDAIFGKVKGLVSSDLPGFLEESLGGAADDVQSFLLKKLAGGDDVLFRGSAALQVPTDADADPVPQDIDGTGTTGAYRISLNLAVRRTDGEAETETVV
jgi:hypothetical protein